MAWQVRDWIGIGSDVVVCGIVRGLAWTGGIWLERGSWRKGAGSYLWDGLVWVRVGAGEYGRLYLISFDLIVEN